MLLPALSAEQWQEKTAHCCLMLTLHSMYDTILMHTDDLDLVSLHSTCQVDTDPAQTFGFGLTTRECWFAYACTATSCTHMCHAGRFKGKPVSIVSTMMGMANMDFVIRECQAVVDGSMVMVRLGTCGALQPPACLGSFLVASEGSVCIRLPISCCTA